MSFSGLASPVTTTVPPLPIALNAAVTTSSSTVPTVTSACGSPGISRFAFLTHLLW